MADPKPAAPPPPPPTQRAAEFQALPLDFISPGPLTAAVKAQAVAAAATRDFINSFTGAGDDKSVTVSVSYTENNTPTTAQVVAPLLSLVPVPHLRIDSLSIHF